MFFPGRGGIDLPSPLKCEDNILMRSCCKLSRGRAELFEDGAEVCSSNLMIWGGTWATMELPYPLGTSSQ